nr:hypothetical protein [Tanacetum cinerariifolium]
MAVTNVKVKKWYGYDHLEEIEARRADQQLYKFMEGDFPRLHLNDIKDMLLLIVQNNLFNIKSDINVDLAAALRMFTRRIVIQKGVEDLQLGVESYGTSYWRSKRQPFYGYASNRVSKHDVYSTKGIMAVTNVKVKKWYGYLSKRTKSKQNGRNRARKWKEFKKSKPKANSSQIYSR